MKKPDKAPLFSFSCLFYDFVKVTSALPGLIAFRPKWLYESPEARQRIRGGALLIGNHSGYFDPVYLQFCVWYRRHHFICTKEFFEGRKAFLFRNFLCIPIDRDNFSMDSFRTITDHLSRGELVSMFPEGHVSGGALSSFKSGMVLMAMRSGKPIVPVYIGSRKNILRRIPMAVGEPVDVKALCGDRPAYSRIEEVTQLLYEKEQKLKALCDAFSQR